MLTWPRQRRSSSAGVRSLDGIIANSPDGRCRRTQPFLVSRNWFGCLAALLLPSFVPARRNEAASAIRLLMLQAAIAVVKDGQAALKQEDLADPYGDGPYKYVELDGGFRIESRLIDRHGKPVTLAVGRPQEKK